MPSGLKSLFRREGRVSSRETRERRVADVWFKMSLSDFVIILSMMYFGKMGEKLARTFEFDRLFLRAGLNIHPSKYGAVTLFLTVISTVLSILALILVMLFVKLPVLMLILSIVGAILTPIIVFTTCLSYPYLQAALRRVQGENELPFFMVYVATMAKGGFSLERVIERVAQLRIFRAMRMEAQRVMTRIKAFGEDPITALEKVAMYHPYTRFRDIMLGYTTTLKSGGDVSHYLEIRSRELLEARAQEIKSILSRLTTYLELYSIFGIILSITLFVFFSVQAAISAAQIAARGGETTSIPVDITFPAIYNFIALPVIGTAVLLAIHMSQPRTPVSYSEVYIALFSWLPVAIPVFIISLVATGGYGILLGRLNLNTLKSLLLAIGVTAVAVSLPPALKYRSIMKRQKGLVRAMADFLRDLSELRKTGLSPEKCIISVSTRNYRNLTPVVSSLGAALNLGLELEEALKRSLRGVKEWFVLASFRFLSDSIIVGGGSPEIIETLAKFVQELSELEEETRRRMRSQVILPYFGAILLASMPIIILYMLLSLAKLPIVSVLPMVLVLALGSIVNSYIMGLVAGKASSATIAAGFLHAMLLTVVSVITLYTTLLFIGG